MLEKVIRSVPNNAIELMTSDNSDNMVNSPREFARIAADVHEEIGLSARQIHPRYNFDVFIVVFQSASELPVVIEFVLKYGF